MGVVRSGIASGTRAVGLPADIWGSVAGALALVFLIFITDKGRLGTYIGFLIYSPPAAGSGSSTAPGSSPAAEADSGGGSGDGILKPTPPAGATEGVQKDRRTTIEFLRDKALSSLFGK